MDLSEAIQALTKAVEENTRVILAGRADAPAPCDVPPPAKPAKAPKAAKPAPKEPEPVADELTYEDHVKPAALGLAAARGRDVLVDVLSKFGVARATELKPEQFGEFIEAVQAAR